MGERIFGADPGLENFGYVLLEDNELKLSGMLGAPKVNKKSRLHFADDLTYRLSLLSSQLRSLFKEHRPKLVLFEAPTFVPSASASVKLFASVAVLISQAVAWNAQVSAVLHEEINAWLGKKKTTKAERKASIAKQVLTRWGNHPWPKDGQGRPLQHPLDAMAVMMSRRSTTKMMI